VDVRLLFGLCSSSSILQEMAVAFYLHDCTVALDYCRSEKRNLNIPSVIIAICENF
jgi:hypothetical protein